MDEIMLWLQELNRNHLISLQFEINDETLSFLQHLKEKNLSRVVENKILIEDHLEKTQDHTLEGCHLAKSV